MPKLFFTSDTHYFHKNIRQYCNRPFESDEEMHNHLIDQHNSVVSKDDHVYHIGDFSFGNEENTASIIKRLNGNIHLVYGNHDRLIQKTPSLQSMFVECVDYKELNIQDEEAIRGRQKIVLSHFPFLQWNGSSHSAWMLHGHSHGSMTYPWPAKILDVGVDCTEFIPIEYEKVKLIMKNKPIPKIDHH